MSVEHFIYEKLTELQFNRKDGKMGFHETRIAAAMPPQQTESNCRRVIISCRWVRYSIVDLRPDLPLAHRLSIA